MNIEGEWHSALERDLAGRLAELLSRGSWLHRWKVKPANAATGGSWDIVASGPIPGGSPAHLCVEVKSENFQPSQFAAIAERPCATRGAAVSRRVLAMPRITPRMAHLCEKHDWSWFDLEGSCSVEIPGVFLVEQSGHLSSIAVARPGARRQLPSANLGTPESARVIRALLAPENAGRRWTQRGLVEEFASGVPPIPPPSLALVNKVIQYLRDQAAIEQEGKRGFRVGDPEGLLRMWRGAYRFDRHVRRAYFTLLKDRALQERLRTLDSGSLGRLAYASFSAADWQAPTVRQPRTWLYLDPNVEDEFRSVAEAKPVDSGENLVVLLPEDRGVFYKVETSTSRPACTNAVQTYVDLVHAGGRGEEAAEAILERRLKPAWSGASQ